MPAMTTRGVKESWTKMIASFIHQALLAKHDEEKLRVLKQDVKTFCESYPVPSLT
jgi:glycine/serine hydroxymethyltransferase